MAKIRRFEDIDAWKEARKLVSLIYSFVKNKQFSKDFALRDQVIRAAISSMSNIAEGFDSATDQQFIQFLVYSRRSCSELQSHLYIALDNEYIIFEEFNNAYSQAETTRKLCSGFITYLRRTSNIQWNRLTSQQASKKTSRLVDRSTGRQEDI